MDGDGRAAFIVLRDHYKGIGVYALDINKTETTLNTLLYGSKKKPHMWWDKFERKLLSAYAAFVKHEGRQVLSQDMKLRKLMGMIKADFLGHIKAILEVRMSETPMTLTFEAAINTLRNAVNTTHPPSTDQPRSTQRHLREANHHGWRGTQDIRIQPAVDLDEVDVVDAAAMVAVEDVADVEATQMCKLKPSP